MVLLMKNSSEPTWGLNRAVISIKYKFGREKFSNPSPRINNSVMPLPALTFPLSSNPASVNFLVHQFSYHLKWAPLLIPNVHTYVVHVLCPISQKYFKFQSFGLYLKVHSLVNLYRLLCTNFRNIH